LITQYLEESKAEGASDDLKTNLTAKANALRSANKETGKEITAAQDSLTAIKDAHSRARAD
jgi:hypothetical protein